MILLAAAAVLCMTVEDRDRARALMLDGIDLALKQHTAHLYDNLLKDRGNGDRMTRGLANGLRLYVRSRDHLLAWSPPVCEASP